MENRLKRVQATSDSDLICPRPSPRRRCPRRCCRRCRLRCLACARRRQGAWLLLLLLLLLLWRRRKCHALGSRHCGARKPIQRRTGRLAGRRPQRAGGQHDELPAVRSEHAGRRQQQRLHGQAIVARWWPEGQAQRQRRCGRRRPAQRRGCRLRCGPHGRLRHGPHRRLGRRPLCSRLGCRRAWRRRRGRRQFWGLEVLHVRQPRLGVGQLLLGAREHLCQVCGAGPGRARQVGAGRGRAGQGGAGDVSRAWQERGCVGRPLHHRLAPSSCRHLGRRPPASAASAPGTAHAAPRSPCWRTRLPGWLSALACPA